MKMYFLAITLFLLASFDSSYAMASNRSDFEIKSLKSEESVSYSVKVAFTKGNILHINTGVAVVIMATEDECILVTAKHLVQNVSSVRVLPLGREWDGQMEIEARVSYIDSLDDVAFLSFTTNHKYVAPNIVLDENVMIGKSVVAFKYLPGNGYQVERGHIIGFWQLLDNKKFMVAKMSIEEGFYGSGLFDDAGNLVGLVSGRNMDKRFKVAYIVSGPKIVAALRRFYK